MDELSIIISLPSGILTFFIGMHLLGKIYGKENDNDWNAYEKIGFYCLLVLMIVVGFGIDALIK